MEINDLYERYLSQNSKGQSYLMAKYDDDDDDGSHMDSDGGMCYDQSEHMDSDDW